MPDDLKLMATAFALTLLLGLAFAVLVKVMVASELERWISKKSLPENSGAVEGDDRHFRNPMNFN